MKNFLKKTVCLVCALSTIMLTSCDSNEVTVSKFKGDVSVFNGGDYRVATEAELAGYSMTAKKLTEDILNAENGGAYIYEEGIENSLWEKNISSILYYAKTDGTIAQMQKEEVWNIDGESGASSVYADNEASYYLDSGEETKYKETGDNHTANLEVRRELGFFGLTSVYRGRQGMFDMFIDEGHTNSQHVSGTKNTEYFIDDSDATCVKIKTVVTWTDYKTEVSEGSMNRFSRFGFDGPNSYSEIGSTITATDVFIVLFDENGICQGALREVEGAYIGVLSDATEIQASFTGYSAFVAWNGQIAVPNDLEVYVEAP